MNHHDTAWKETQANARAHKRRIATEERRIEKAYPHNVAIPIMKIGDIFKAGHALIATGADDETLAKHLRAMGEALAIAV